MSEEHYDAYEKAKDMTMEEAYDYCLKLEYDRERKHRDTDIGQIEASTLSLDQLVESFEDPSKIQIFSDCGKGFGTVFFSLLRKLRQAAVKAVYIIIIHILFLSVL